MNELRFSSYNNTLYGVSLIAGPAVLLASSIFHFTGGGMDSDDVGGTLQILAFFFFIFAALGLTQLMSKRRPRIACILRALLVLGSVYGAINGLGSVMADAAGVGITSLPRGLAMLLVFPGIVFPLSLLVLGFVLWRNELVPAPAGVMLALAGFLFPVGRIPDIIALYFVTDALLIVSMGWIGLRVLKNRHTDILVEAGRDT